MLKRTVAMMLSGFIVLAGMAQQTIRAQALQESSATQKAREKVRTMGTGSNAKVEVKLNDGVKLKGYISAATDDSFTLADAKTGSSQDIKYSEVTQVKKSGGGLSSRGWIIIAGAATAAAIVGFTVVKPVLCDGGAGC